MRPLAFTQHDLHEARCRCGRPDCLGEQGFVPIACETDHKHQLVPIYEVATRTLVLACASCGSTIRIAVAPDVIECEAAMGVA